MCPGYDGQNLRCVIKRLTGQYRLPAARIPGGVSGEKEIPSEH